MSKRRPGLPLGYWAPGGAVLGFPIPPALKKNTACRVPPCAQYRIHRGPVNSVCSVHVQWGGPGAKRRPTHERTQTPAHRRTRTDARTQTHAHRCKRTHPRAHPGPHTQTHTHTHACTQTHDARTHARTHALKMRDHSRGWRARVGVERQKNNAKQRTRKWPIKNAR